MKLLLDENLPRRLRWYLPGHDVSTVAYLGWRSFDDGIVLDLAEQYGFEAVLTADGNLPYQQNIARRKLAVILLGTNKWDGIEANLPKIQSAIDSSAPGLLISVAPDIL